MIRFVTLNLLLLGLAGCQQEASLPIPELNGSSPARGQAAIQKYGCSSCHTIPGITGANGLVGPPLIHMAQRAYIAGVLKNTPENMVQWLLNPPQVDHLTAMPKVGLSDAEARDIASYLYQLK